MRGTWLRLRVYEGVQRLRSSLDTNPGLRLGVWWNVGLLLLTLLPMPFDHRRILGISPWIKPLKFEVSVLIYLLTISLMVESLPEPVRWRRSRLLIGWGVGVSMILENTVIALQAARGVRSHMNYTTLHDALLFAAMGIFILLNTVLAGWLFALWCWPQPRRRSVVTWGVRLGLLFLLAGSLEGARMVQGGAHTVGAADGGPGLPLVNWSRGHGDLRVAHFLALHALQLLPLAGMGLARLRWPFRAQVGALLALSGGYAAAVWWLFAQAIAGHPLLP